MTSETKQEVAPAKGQEIQKMKPARMANPLEELERAVERFMGRGWMRPFLFERPLWGDLMEPFEARTPRMDVIDQDEDILVRVEVPGIEKKDLDVSVTDNMLTVKGKASREEKEEKGDYYRCEISRSAFSRTVSLPASVDGTKVAAALKDGVLEITLPKLEGSRRHSIRVQ